MTRRTTIQVDDDLLAAAQEVLGTSGLQATVDGALHCVVRAARRRRLAERLRTGGVVDPEAVRTARAWRWIAPRGSL